MEISDFIRIKRNVDQIIEMELSGNPQNQIKEYIEMLENELVKKDIEVIMPEIELDLNEQSSSDYYIGTTWTKKDLENECNEYFEKYHLEKNIHTLSSEKYHEEMSKAYNRMKQRKHHRMKQINN
tara:strand:- start:272 stop:646 length:375 start_codon:yes stop_codon:yes gene_type:complete